MAAGVALLIVLALYERARDRAGSDPLVLPSLFRRRAFSGGLVLGLVWFTGIMGRCSSLRCICRWGWATRRSTPASR